MSARALLASMLAVSVAGCIYAPHYDHDEHASSPYGPPPSNPPAPGAPPPPVVPHPEPEEGETEPELPHDPDGLEVAIRLRGLNVGDYREVLAMVHEVSVLVDGRPVRFDLRDEVLNLAQPNHAWLLGSFSLPKTSSEVSVSVRFGPTAGTMATGGAGTIDLRAAPMRFHVPAGHLRHNAHGVVHLDLGRSLVPAEKNPLLLPVFSVQY